MRHRVVRLAGNAVRFWRPRPAMAMTCAAIGATLIVPGPASAQMAEVTREIEVAAGVPTVVGRPQKLSRECEHTVPEVTILEIPAGGAVSVRPARYSIGDVIVGQVAGTENKPDCEVVDVDGLEVVYTPLDGTSQDRLVLQMAYPFSGERPDQVIVMTLEIEVTP